MIGCTMAFVLKEDPEGTSSLNTSSRDFQETGRSIENPSQSSNRTDFNSFCTYSRITITRTFRGNRKRFELSGVDNK